MSSDRILRVGIIGCGEVSQVIHIPTLNLLTHRFRITYLCDISRQALEFCAARVDVVIVANADPFHVEHGLLALKHNKYCLIEKPLALNFRDVDRILEAEKTSAGKVFVGTMRRYAPAFLDAVKEVGGMENIKYARVRDIIGPNPAFVAQSGTFPQRFSDIGEADAKEFVDRETDIYEQALKNEFDIPVNPQSKRMLRVLGALGTHDLSAMREIIGMPKSVAGAVLTLPGIFSVLFQYDDFPVVYESGLINVMEFDAHIEIYSTNKVVRVQYDSPYIKALPVTMTVRETVGDGGFQERTIRKTFEDPYTLEFLEFYDCAAHGKVPKTSAADSRNEIELYKMILQAGASRLLVF
ncbi:unnamed protein product [Parascedosporium putredinis]|uniref:Gfo/Idh/MocA-like oxidoreductase N-terminal domain-containing protein n=1 Tax=Parascedosporium putredinis TaxID=1442378 RepID=A0A9P1GYU9_9PEZI|nr:unnamed protein product [Parascedosporium putredinis]CAI7991119.1 unnamed protein product [Parascedosporium putredinis]